MVIVKSTPRVQRVLRHAERIAREQGHDYIGTEHLLLGLFAEPDGIAAQVLTRLNVTAAADALVREVMASPGYAGKA
jgi:ATP-dependent Clp protease ATP-binding subunit ClpC